MKRWSRREWLLGAAALAAPFACRSREEDRLTLVDFEPRSMLQVVETDVPRAAFPAIDFHSHMSWSSIPLGGDGGYGERMDLLAAPDEILEVMDRKNVAAMVNLTGGVGEGLASVLREFDESHPGRFLTFTEPSWNAFARSDFATFQADQIEKARAMGAKGLKLTKTLGLYLRENVTEGPLVHVDDPRFDPTWETCGGLGIPVAIHVSDPDAFFTETNRENERYEELSNHPDWSFFGRDFPTKAELLEARNRVFERHPRTAFVALHVGNRPEDLDYVASCLDRFPNVHVEIGARIGELGRQPRTARRFFDRYQDRILFGTDAVPPPLGLETPQQVFSDELYEIYFRFLESEDEYFHYAPAKVPPQGRWRIYGIGLDEPVLKKVYRENAARLLGLG
jgi:predicted TIM-barrel fold metal-dependent hydrolase